MSKKKIIILSVIVILIGIASILSTYALDITMTKGTSSNYDMSLTFDISGNVNKELSVEAGKTKTFDIVVNNPYTDTITYGIAYKMLNPTTKPDDLIIAVTNISENPSEGTIDANSKKVISLIIVNDSTSNIQVSLSVINGYKNGGDLIIPTGYTIISDVYEVDSTSHRPIDNSGANYPDLVEGLIPVVYNETTSKWVKADTKSSTSTYGWYDYTNKKWANAVLVSNTTVIDLSSNNNNATIYGATYVDEGLSISDSSNTYVLLPSNSQVTFPATYSLTFTLNSLDNQVFFGDYNTKAGLGIINNGANFVTGIGTTAQSNTIITGGLSVNTEYTVDLVYHSITNVDVYLNGNLLSKSSTTDYWGWSDTNSYIGKRGNGQSNFNGIIKRYIVYNDELTTDEINKNLNVSDSTICNSGIVCDNLKQYYNFKSSLRTSYINSLPGTEITDSDILAFYVWIPRYKYKVWNINKVENTDSYNARTTGIDIRFESNTGTTGTINCTYNFNVDTANGGIDLFKTTTETCTGSNGDYYTHPAFTFGDTELKGFWIGKFELTGTSSEVTILPSVSSLREQTVSGFNTIVQNMQTTNNIYGLGADKSLTDSHMIKNMEWGAVAYLTNSNYGRCSGGTCTEVTTNNCSSYVTGIGANTVDDDKSSTTCTTDANKYNGAKGVLASTTGNVYGVYDMNGGSWEYVMGNMSVASSSYIFYPRNSGFSDDWYTSNQKYINTYANYDAISGSHQAAYNRARLGDATGEVILNSGGGGGWYDNDAIFPYSDYSWFNRGCSASSSVTGIFCFNSDYGKASGIDSTRAVLVGLS